MSQALDTVLAPAKEAFTPALFSRVRAHLYSQLLCMGRHTITGLLSTQGRVYQDWSADYRLYANRRLDPQVLFDCVKGELRVDESKPWRRVRAFACGRMHQFKVKRLQGALSPILGAPACQLLVIAPLGYRPRAGSKLLYRQPAYLLCTDPKLSLRRLLQYYLWRWDIEVNFRDEKTTLGVGQAQVRTPGSTGRVPATAVAAYGLLLAAAARAFPNQEDPRLFPPPRWRPKSPPRPSTSALLDHLGFELFAHALKPESFTGFWSRPCPNENPSKLPVALASSLFHRRL